MDTRVQLMPKADRTCRLLNLRTGKRLSDYRPGSSEPRQIKETRACLCGLARGSMIRPAPIAIGLREPLPNRVAAGPHSVRHSPSDAAP